MNKLGLSDSVERLVSINEPAVVERFALGAHMKTRISVSVVGLGLIALLGVWYLFTGDTFIRQERNMKRAGEHLPVVRAALDAVPEFRHLTVGVFTGAGGSLAVGGSLPSDSDVQRVRQVVERTAPPVRVVYHVIATNDLR